MGTAERGVEGQACASESCRAGTSSALTRAYVAKAHALMRHGAHCFRCTGPWKAQVACDHLLLHQRGSEDVPGTSLQLAVAYGWRWPGNSRSAMLHACSTVLSGIQD